MKPNRWTSRKFLLSVSAQLTALAVAIWPAHQAELTQAVSAAAALVVVALSALGYVHEEAKLDQRNKK